jgi:hypothetical protein
MFNNPLIIKKTIDDVHSTLFSSLLLYYYGKIKINKKFLRKSKTFSKLINASKIIIVDYVNIMYILYKKYEDYDKTIIHFYNYIYNQLLKPNVYIFIISKTTVIDYHKFDIETVLNKGTILTKKSINSKCFNNDRLSIYNLSYKQSINSSIDDMIYNMIFVICFVALITTNKNPKKKILLITNDKQYFDKNLFGKIPNENRQKIIISQLKIIDDNYKLSRNSVDNIILKSFLKDFSRINVDTGMDQMETQINELLQLMIKGNKGNKQIMKMSSFIRNQKLTKNTIKNFKYKNINQLQKKYYKSKKDLKVYMYLYVFIKYAQWFITSDLYGNLSHDDITKLI